MRDIESIIERLEKGEETTPFSLSETIARIVGTYRLEFGVPNFPLYATSLDAALTLVPEGLEVALDQALTEGRWYAGVNVPETHYTPTPEDAHRGLLAARSRGRGKASSPALALCIAALKARAAS